ncbi:MAG TPA: methyltransferase domain-containing protein [Thermoanaerobaculia bacterium]
MRADVLPLLRCPVCAAGDLAISVFRPGESGEVGEGVVWCRACRRWFPVEDGLLDLLVGDLAYEEDRQRFAATWSGRLAGLGLAAAEPPSGESPQRLQSVQQGHFDWYARNDTQSYRQYEEMPFWRAADRIAFTPWREEVRPGARLLDVGCAQGRSTFKLLDLDLDVVAFDVSKLLVRQAIERRRRNGCRARVTFLAADGARFPFVDDAFDHVLVYGVLHHLPDPGEACREVARVLRGGGTYFGSENNRTALRALFDVVQKWCPLWHEEAGPDPLIGKRELERWFAGSGVEITTRSSVFLPPHLINAFSAESGYRLLAFFDRVGRALGPLGRHGGLILVHGVKGELRSSEGG